MARKVQLLDEILVESTALVQRVALKIDGSNSIYVLGLRREGGLSIFCEDEPVYQFNSIHQLRRAFWRGQRIKADGGDLMKMSKKRMGGKVELISTKLTVEERVVLLAELEQHLLKLCQAIDRREVKIVVKVPEQEDILKPMRDQLGQIETPAEIAAVPHVG